MPLDFPSSPSNGQVYDQWQWDGSKWVAIVGTLPAGPAGPAGPTGPAGAGVAAGGTTGQALTKINATDFNTQWTGPYLTGNQSITLSGDISGSGTTAIPTTLATVNANVGTFAVSTVNAKGLVTAAANMTGDITTAAGVSTLATVNANVGTFAVATVNAKGLVTAAANMTGDVTTSNGVATLATVTVAKGGTGATTAGAALTNLGAAPLASPAFTGTPSLPTGTTGITQAATTNNTTLATTAFVKSQTTGVTDGSNAAAGQIGEFLSASLASGSAVTLTTGTLANILTLVLTAGDWQVAAGATFNPSAGTANVLVAGLSTISGSAPGTPTLGLLQLSGASLSLGSSTVLVGPIRFNVTSSTTIYLVGQLNFSTGTGSAHGTITARRMR